MGAGQRAGKGLARAARQLVAPGWANSGVHNIRGEQGNFGLLGTQLPCTIMAVKEGTTCDTTNQTSVVKCVCSTALGGGVKSLHSHAS